MSITREQIIDLGFSPTKKKSPFAIKYDTLILKLNSTDYLYTGYSQVTKGINYKKIWKSCIVDGGRVDYQIANIGETSFTELKNYIKKHRELEDVG